MSRIHYHVGVNTPGYLPEGEPYRVDTLVSARAAVAYEKRRIIDEDWTDEGSAWSASGSSRTGSVYLDRKDGSGLGLHIWYQPCSDAECTEEEAPRTFGSLNIGERFIFTGEIEFPYSGIAKGPWIKISPRKYRHESDDIEIRVGSTSAEVASPR